MKGSRHNSSGGTTEGGRRKESGMRGMIGSQKKHMEKFVFRVSLLIAPRLSEVLFENYHYTFMKVNHLNNCFCHRALQKEGVRSKVTSKFYVLFKVVLLTSPLRSKMLFEIMNNLNYFNLFFLMIARSAAINIRYD